MTAGSTLLLLLEGAGDGPPPPDPAASPLLAAAESELLGQFADLRDARPAAYAGPAPWAALAGPARAAIKLAGGVIGGFSAPDDAALLTVPEGREDLFRFALRYHAADSAAGSYRDVDTTAAGVAKYNDQLYQRLLNIRDGARAWIEANYPGAMGGGTRVGWVNMIPTGARGRGGWRGC